MEEVWKKVINYDNYEVSSLGRVRCKGKIRLLQKNYRNKHIYTLITVALSKNGVKKVFTVSRLVALAFLPNPENKRTVDHIDRDTGNNCVENLQWATHAEQNDNKSFKIGVSGHKNICKTEVGQHWIVRIMRNYKIVYCKQFDTIEDAIKSRDDFLASPLLAS